MKRLELIASLINSSDVVADIGADHGHVIKLLVERNHPSKILGVENKIGPFKTLSSNLKKEIESNRVMVSFSDGLNEIGSEYNCVIICGMGPATICNILLNNIKKALLIDKFVIQANGPNAAIDRFFKEKLGYTLTSVNYLNEENIDYFIKVYNRTCDKIDFKESDFYLNDLRILKKNNPERFNEVIGRKEKEIVIYNKYLESKKNFKIDREYIIKRIQERIKYEY